MSLHPAARRALAAAALSGIAANGCTNPPPEPRHTAYSDQPKYDVPRSQEKPSDYDVRLRATHRATRSQAMRSNVAQPAPRAPEASAGDERTVVSTAYCLTGTMANGQRVHHGAVAMNGVPLGSVWQVDGGATYTVADRIGHGSQFDIAMPGDCAAALAYGRRTITVRRIA